MSTDSRCCWQGDDFRNEFCSGGPPYMRLQRPSAVSQQLTGGPSLSAVAHSKNFENLRERPRERRMSTMTRASVYAGRRRLDDGGDFWRRSLNSCRRRSSLPRNCSSLTQSLTHVLRERTKQRKNPSNEGDLPIAQFVGRLGASGPFRLRSLRSGAARAPASAAATPPDLPKRN